MFARGATPGKVHTWSYDEDEEDFTKGMRLKSVIPGPCIDASEILDATALDAWVVNQLEILLQNATLNNTLDLQLRGDKVIFFLHLLGLDTTGHSYRPHSKVCPSIIAIHIWIQLRLAGVHE
jgi:GPI ethanolamine phosphate transferase 1